MPLRLLVESFGWRPVMVVTAIVTAALCLAIFLFVRDDPSERGYANHAPAPAASGTHHGSVWHGLMQVLSYRNSWILVIVPIGVAGVSAHLRRTLGVPYLKQVYWARHTRPRRPSPRRCSSRGRSAGRSSARCLNASAGANRSMATTVVALIGWGIVIYLPLPIWALVGVLIVSESSPATCSPSAKESFVASDGHGLRCLQHGPADRRHVPPQPGVGWFSTAHCGWAAPPAA